MFLTRADTRFLEIQMKLEDLENTSRRNNLRVIGLPETYKPQHLMDICQTDIPRAMGLKVQYTAERAHRIGPPLQDRQSPRPVIVRYLNYADKNTILQKFWSQASLEIDGIRLLLFADYSAKLSKKRKLFSPLCSMLHDKKIKYALTYPAILRITSADGQQRAFEDTEEAEAFINSHIEHPENLQIEPMQLRQLPSTPHRMLPRDTKAIKGEMVEHSEIDQDTF